MVAKNILWDTDGDMLALSDLPHRMRIPKSMTDPEEISDYLTEKTGYCHKGFDLIQEELEEFEQECYEAYQLEWMLSHEYSLAEALNTVGSNFQDSINKEKPDIADAYNILYGEGYKYVSGQAAEFSTKEEFLKEEFLSATYMDRLLSLMPEPAKKKALWKKIVEGGEADEQ